VEDDVLAERVRSRLGVYVSHPHAIQVQASGGAVTLSGPILRREAQALIRHLRHVPGVHDVIDRLERHASTNRTPALQGGVARARRPEILQENWAPGVRLLAGGAGLVLVGAGLSRHKLLAAAGVATLLRAGGVGRARNSQAWS